MERLLVLKLDAVDCEAEACVNGVPLARVNAARQCVIVPIHEYTMAGPNQLDLVIWPRPAVTPETPALATEPRVADGKRLAQLRILLPRINSMAHEASARTLAQIEWAAPEGEAYEAPLVLSQNFGLPVSFPRWRWLDAPAIEDTPALHAQALTVVQGLSRDLAAGQPERFLAATRLRTEEIALAYQRRPEDETQRLRDHLLALHAEGRLKWLPLTPETLVLRPIASGRLLECLGADGGPALSTQPDDQGGSLSLPLRVTAVDGKLYVLR
jgi:hypothetical protein